MERQLRGLIGAARVAQNRAVRPPYSVPPWIGPVESGSLGSWVTVRCPRDYDNPMRNPVDSGSPVPAAG